MQSSPILQICHLAQKTQCLGSHLPRPLVLYTTMTRKVDKDGSWQKFYPPSRGKGVTGKEWQEALKRKQAAFHKAAQSDYAFLKANTAAVRAEIAFTTANAAAARAEIAFNKAVAKAKKLEKRAQLDLKRANALE